MDEFRDQEMQDIAGTVSARDLSDIVGQGEGYRDLNRREGELLNGNVEDNSLKDPSITHPTTTEKDVAKKEDPKVFSVDLTPPSTPQDEQLSSNAEKISLESAESAMGYLKGGDSPEVQEKQSNERNDDLMMGNTGVEEGSKSSTQQDTFSSDIVKENSPLPSLDENEYSFLDDYGQSHEDNGNKSPSPLHEQSKGEASHLHELDHDQSKKEVSPIPEYNNGDQLKREASPLHEYGHEDLSKREPSPLHVYDHEDQPKREPSPLHEDQPKREPSPLHDSTFQRIEPEVSPVPEREPSPILTIKKENSPVPQREPSPIHTIEKEDSPVPQKEPSPILTIEKEASPHLEQSEDHSSANSLGDKESSPQTFNERESSPEPFQKQDPTPVDQDIIDAPTHNQKESDSLAQFTHHEDNTHIPENDKDPSLIQTFEKDPTPLPEVVKTEPSPTYPAEKDLSSISKEEVETPARTDPVVTYENASVEQATESSSPLPPKKEDLVQPDVMTSLTTKDISESPYEPQLTPEPDVLLSTPQGGTPEPESPSQMTPEPSLRDDCITPPNTHQTEDKSDAMEISDYIHPQETAQKQESASYKDELQEEREAAVFSTPEPDSTTSTILNITALTDAWLQKLPPVVLDLIYWRDTQKSGVVYGSGMAFLLLLRWMSLISVVSYMSLVALSAAMSFRIYKYAMQVIQKTPDGHPFKEYLEMDVTIPEDKVMHTAEVALAKLNCMVSELRRLFLVEDFVDSLKLGVLLWCLTYIGSWFNSSTLIILGYVALFTLPKVYEINQTQIDQYIDLVRTQFEEIQAKVRGLIPLGGSKEKAQ